MSNAELIAEVSELLREEASPTNAMKIFSWTLLKVETLAAALEKSEAEVARLRGVIAAAIRVEDSMLDQSFYSIVGEMVRVLERGTSATVSAEEEKPRCGCVECNPGWWGMCLCSLCGNKRCPHATNHNYDCTQSNEYGQIATLTHTDKEGAK